MTSTLFAPSRPASRSDDGAPTDREVLDRVRRNEPSASAVLYERCGQLARSFARTLNPTVEPHDLDAIVARAVAAVLVAARSADTGCRASAFLVVTTRNAVLDASRPGLTGPALRCGDQGSSTAEAAGSR